MAERTIEKTLELKAPLDRVWEAITDAEELAKWFGDEAVIDIQTRKYAYHMNMKKAGLNG